MAKETINWKKMWTKFDAWLDNPDGKSPCRTCGNLEHKFPDWEDQQRKIKQLVNDQVREILKNKM